MQRKNIAQILLIAGLVFVFVLFGVGKLTDPLVWLGWMPLWMEGLMGLSRTSWMTIIGISEIAMAILLVIPVRRVRQVGTIIVALHLLGVLTQTGWNDIAVRDIGLLFMALGLLALI